MERMNKERICSFLLAAVMLVTSLISSAITVSAKEPKIPVHTISVEETDHGSLTVKDAQSTAYAGTTVQLVAQAEDGYQLKEIFINDGTVLAGQIPETENEFRFVMPDEAVFIKASFATKTAESGQVLSTAAALTKDKIEQAFSESEKEVEKEDGEKKSDTEMMEEEDMASKIEDEKLSSETEAIDAASDSDIGSTLPDEEVLEENLKEAETKEKITGIYFEYQTLEEILELAENGLDLQDFFRYSIWGFLDVDDLRYLVENGITLDALYRAMEGEPTYYNRDEILSMIEKYQRSQRRPARIAGYALRSISGSTATAAITGPVSDSALGSIPAFGPGSHSNMLRITLSGESAFCAKWGAACRTGMTYNKVSGDEIGIDRSQQYLIYRIVGWYYEAQQIHDNTGNYAITQAAIWLVRNGQWGSPESMAAAIRPMLTKVSVLTDEMSITLFKAMAEWVNGDAQPRVGIDFWENGPNQYLVTVGGDTYIETEDPEYSAYVKIHKTDSVTGEGINGTAEFKIYTEDGTDTGATFSKSGNTYTSSIIIKDEDHDTFYVQETGAPAGYLTDSEKYYFTIEDGDEEAEKVITNHGGSFQNSPYWVQISIPKVDSETGKIIANGAEFTVTASSGKLSQAVSFTKQADGSYLSGRVYYNESNLGSFFVQETKAPANYYGDWADESAAKTPGSNTNKVKYAFTVSQATHGQILKITNKDGKFINDRVKGVIHVSKIDVEAGAYVSGETAHGDAVLDGAVYGLYARKDILYPDGTSGIKYPAGTLVTEGTIREGRLTWENLYLGSYFIKEITPPVGYLADTKEYDVTLTYADESAEIVTQNTVVEEQVKKRAFQLRKLEGESLNEQLELSGAGFEVYLLSDLGIDAAGKSDEALLQEVLDQYPDYKNGLDKTALAKLYENDESEISKYNATQADVGGTGLTKIGTNRYQLNEIFTDSSGYAASPELPYGTYIVVETTVPKNTLIDIKPFIVHVDEDSREVMYQRYFLDKDFKAKIKIIKTDADTGMTVLKAGTSYKIYDIDHEKYVQLPIVVNNKEEIKEIFTTDTEGYILTDAVLPCGKYRIEEVQGPEGFYNEAVGSNSTLGTVTFEINTDQTYQTSGISGDAIIEFKYSNRETRGELTIEKIGEKLVSVKNVPSGNSIIDALAKMFRAGDQDVRFVYEKLPVAGAEYTIKAAENIYTQDNQQDKDGNRTTWFKMGETAAVLVTGADGQIDDVKYPAGGYTEHPIVQVIHRGENGKAVIRLPLGSYTVFESKAPYGYLHTNEVKEVTFTWENQTEEIVFNSTPATGEDGTAVFENERVKPITEEKHTEIGVGIYKQDRDTKEPVENTVFGLYTANDIFNAEGDLIVPADTLLGTAKTDANGFGYFDIDIPYMSENYGRDGSTAGLNSGDYYIVEHEVPGGFFLDPTPLTVHFEYRDENTPYIVVQARQENISTFVDISKLELSTGKPLAGAVLQIIEKATGEVIYEFTTTGEVHTVRRLKLSMEDAENIYILHESRPAAGYVTAENMEFKLIQAKDEDGTLLMEADIYVLKDTGETREETDTAKGDSEKGSLFQFNWLRTMAGEKRSLAWVKASEKTVVMEDDITKLYINKHDIADGKPVMGAEMEITDPDGNVIEKWTTTEEDHYIEKLPVGEYILKETLAPTADGYVRAEDIPFTVEDDGSIQKVRMADDYTKIDITKVDVAGKEVPGAHLVLKDKEGNIVDEWDSTDEPHRIERIEPGEYTLSETVVPDGYIQAETITFVVKETGEVQKVEMVNIGIEVMGHIEIYKTGDVLKGYTSHSSDFGTIHRLEFEKENLSGVEFTVYDASGKAVDVIKTDEKGYGISKELVVGNYVVKETKTPSGLAANYNEYKVKISYSKEAGVVNAVLKVENRVLDTEINVYKVGEMVQSGDGTFGYGSKPLEGVFFGIYTDEDIKAADGRGILSKDSLIGVIKTNKDGKATLRSALVSGKYYYKELQTLPGYILDASRHTFDLSLGNEPTTIFEVNKENPLLNKAKKNMVQLIKVDAADLTRRLAGVEFELYTKDGEKIGTYQTDANGEINITNLAYGKYYFKETRSLKGYQIIRGKIHFEIGDEKVVITCKNTTIPKLGFEDSYLNFAAGGVLIASAGLVLCMALRARKRKKETENN